MAIVHIVNKIEIDKNIIEAEAKKYLNLISVIKK